VTAPPAVFSGAVDVLSGVLLLLLGLGTALLGAVAVANRRVRSGLLGATAGVLLGLAGLWLVGLFGS